MEPGNIPDIPLPNPGEGGSLPNGTMPPEINNNGNRMNGNGGMSGNNNRMNGMQNNENVLNPNIINSIISTYPRPNEPCTLCNGNNTRIGNVRFLNAAAGYNPFVVFVNENLLSSGLGFGELTNYERASAGKQMVTLMGENGYIYLQKPVEIQSNESVTIAIINAESGIDVQLIADKGCERDSGMACVRVANLSYNSGALSVVIGNQYVNFNNLRYRAVSNFEPIWSGRYIYNVMQNMVARFPGFGSTVLLTAYLNLQNNRNYTIYLLNWKRDSSDAIRAIVVED